MWKTKKQLEGVKKDLEEKLKIEEEELEDMELKEKIEKMDLERFEGLRSNEKKEQERERELVRERNRARKERAEKLEEEWYKKYEWMDQDCLCAGGVANLCEGCDWQQNGRWGGWPREHEVVWWEEGIEKRGWYKEGKGVRKY